MSTARPHTTRPRNSWVLLLALGGLCACQRHESQGGKGRGVLVIAVDALRADHMSCNGYDRATTPTLDTLAAAGVSFTSHYSTAPWNLPATASQLTGCDPNGSRRLLPAGLPNTLATRWNVPEQAPRLAQQFLLAGWSTAAFVDHANLAEVYGLGAGFQQWSSTADADPAKPEELGMEGIMRPLVQWLRARNHDENWFAFVHLHDLERIWQASNPRWDTSFTPRPELSAVPPVGDAEHLFHAIPRARWSGGMTSIGEYEARYDGALLRLDGQFKWLFNQVAQMGWLKGTTLCVVGTHGLGFGEAGLLLDHGTLDDVDLRVPWILRPADTASITLGGRVGALSSALDVAPTLLEFSGLEVPAAMRGVSFKELLAGGSTAPRDHVVARCGFQDGYAVIDADWTLEITQPWLVDDDLLARSWYGHGPVYPEEQRIQLRARTGARRTADSPEESPEEALKRLCLLGVTWVRDVEAMRASLQTVDWLTRAGFEPQSDVVELGPCAPAARAER